MLFLYFGVNIKVKITNYDLKWQATCDLWNFSVEILFLDCIYWNKATVEIVLKKHTSLTSVM